MNRYVEGLIDSLVGNLITIELFGQTYTFKTESEMSIAEAVADSLVKEVARIQGGGDRQSSELTKLTVMILAALNFAKENNELKMRHAELLAKMTERSSVLLKRIDAHFDTTA